MTPFEVFTQRFKLFVSKNPDLILTTLGNIFTMRLIGNKTHGDLAEIALAEFVNQFMYDYSSIHVGKDLFRAKEHEEDLKIFDEINQTEFSLSLKAYGDGSLQLSTDKHFLMFPRLQEMGESIEGKKLKAIWQDGAFAELGQLNVFPLIYNEKNKTCNIQIFNFQQAKERTVRIVYETSGKQRKHPVYRFYDKNQGYICEVRYGGSTANALQRGFWTHTKNASPYFESLTGGWVSYAENPLLVKLLSYALLSTQKGHEKALEPLMLDLAQQKRGLL
jgi:hypothetical protein